MTILRAQMKDHTNEISCVYEQHYYNFDFKLTSDAKIQPAFTWREGSRY